MKKFFYMPMIAGAILATSCDPDDVVKEEVNAPATYQFQRDGKSTVNFNGQTTRILMAEEILDAFEKWDMVTDAKLQSMLNHQEGNADFNDKMLNASSKNILGKIAASKGLFGDNSTLSSKIKDEFKGWITDYTTNVVPNKDSLASAGVAGQIVVGGKVRYVNAQGLEVKQVFAKGLIGALITDQTLNNYLNASVLDSGDKLSNNNSGITKEGKNYTEMEHNWDEAYGYVYGGKVTNEADPNKDADKTHNSFLHKYSQSVASNPNFKGIDNDIFNAFKLGRAAIVAHAYKVRDTQIKSLRKDISTVVAVRAIHYLQEGKEKIVANDRVGGFHHLSEGFGFLYSLQFTNNPDTNQPYLSHEEVMSLVNKLEANNGLWDVSAETLDEISEAIAAKFPFTVEQAK